MKSGQQGKRTFLRCWTSFILEKPRRRLISANLTIHCPESSAFLFYPLLRRGYLVPASGDTSLKSLLMQELELSGEAGLDSIQTVLLDGAAVDDMGRAFPEDGSTVALSAAMPGLLGACLRRGGSLAAMREGITYFEPSDPVQERGSIILRLKLYNLLLQQWGLFLLVRGILVEARDLREVMERFEQEWESSRLKASTDSEELDFFSLRQWLGSFPARERISFRLNTAESS